MEFDFLKYFYTNKFDDEIIFVDGSRKVSIGALKGLVFKKEQEFDKNSFEVEIQTDSPLDFVVTFLASIFAGKNIVISNANKKRILPLCGDDEGVCAGKNHIGASIAHVEAQGEISFQKIDLEKIKLTIFTSGTTSCPKRIEKKMSAALNEALDVIEAFFSGGQKFIFSSTVPLNHMYSITVYVLVPLCLRGVINLSKINYPKDFSCIEDGYKQVLISSPSFLSCMVKNDLEFDFSPDVILSAGAELKKEIHAFFEKKSRVINLYGVTETGFIGYCEKSEEKKFKLFSGIKILRTSSDCTVVTSNYSFSGEIILDDIINFENDKIEIVGRRDGVLKIAEKRVSIKEIEGELLKNDLIKNCKMIDFEGKLAAVAVLSDLGVEFFLKFGLVEIIKKLKNVLVEKFEIIPQKWKFIDVLPVNKMGKIDKEKILEIFNLNLSLPFILKREIFQYEACFELFFHRNCNFYKGHFDNFPITAGVIQLFYAQYFANIAFEPSYGCILGQIKKLKFSNIIPPDSIVKLKLLKKEKSIHFEYLSAETVYSSGVLPLQNVFSNSKIETLSECATRWEEQK